MQPDTETLAIRSQLSPFKVGAIQQLIADGDADLGKKTAPYFAIILVLFLLAFLGYFVTALVALVVCRLQIDSRIRTRLCTCNHCISRSCSPARRMKRFRCSARGSPCTAHSLSRSRNAHATAGCDGNGRRVCRGNVYLAVRLYRPRVANNSGCPHW